MAQTHVLVVGVGSIGERHLRCFQATGRAALSFCETNPELSQRIAERYNVQRHYATLEEALAEGAEAFDVAVIATPAPLHVPMAVSLINAGIHTFVEKPLSLTLDGVADLDALAKKESVVTAVAFTYRSHPALLDMKAAIDSGRFGKPVQLVSVWGQHFPFYRPAYREIYYTSRETGGGLIQDLLPHAINAGEWLVGPVDRVMADAEHKVLEGVDVEDTVHVLARQGDGVMACYSANQHQAPNENTITVMCERGTARFDLNRAKWQSMTEPGGEWADEFCFSVERDDIFINQANLFLDAVASKVKVNCTIADGMQTLKAILAILEAVEQPGWRTV